MRYTRPLSVCSETRLSPSFLRTTPERKPRTECCCHSVAVTRDAIVVPAGVRSIAIIRACLVLGPVAGLDNTCADCARDLPVFRAIERVKEHWLGWLSEYDGPGAYGRKSWKGRSAEFVYNHIGCPPMLLWLAEAAGVPKTKVLAAKRSALATGGRRATHCAKIRTAIPWSVIEERLR